MAPPPSSRRRWGPAAKLPETVGPRRLASTRPLQIRIAVTLALAVGIPLAAAVAVTASSSTGWVYVGFGLMLGVAGLAADRSVRGRRRHEPTGSWPEARVALERLCMRADLLVPELVIDRDEIATAWTSGGRLHVTTALLETLDPAEVEAVIAHELAHVAHRDAAAMDLATAPSRVLLGLVLVCLHPGRLPADNHPGLGARAGLVMFGVLYVPVGLVLGWSSRLWVLSLSRARELAADTSAATLTGRPSALASALLKLGPSEDRAPRTDLRTIEALCIVELGSSHRGRLLHTHPPIRRRVERLEAMEERLQAAS